MVGRPTDTVAAPNGQSHVRAARGMGDNPHFGEQLAAIAVASRLDEPPPDCVASELDAIAHAELFKDVRTMALDGLFADEQDLGDFAACVAPPPPA